MKKYPSIYLEHFEKVVVASISSMESNRDWSLAQFVDQWA